MQEVLFLASSFRQCAQMLNAVKLRFNFSWNMRAVKTNKQTNMTQENTGQIVGTVFVTTNSSKQQTKHEYYISLNQARHVVTLRI